MFSVFLLILPTMSSVVHCQYKAAHVLSVDIITNHASRFWLACTINRNDPKIKWPPQSMYYTSKGSNSAVDGLHVKMSSYAVQSCQVKPSITAANVFEVAN